MLVALTVCPHPPLLVPEVSVAEPVWLADLRRLCHAAVWRLVESRPREIVVIGPGEGNRTYDSNAHGSLHTYGVDIASGGDNASPQRLPLSLTIGAWLLDQAGWFGPRRYLAVDDADAPGDAAATGADLVAGESGVGLLVMGDGSAKRSTTAPGYLDPNAAPFDRYIVDALRSLDGDALLAVDAVKADELWAAGAPAWHCLAGALSRARPRGQATVSYDDAPCGVGYYVVDWQAVSSV